jgi:hypothetical protein
MVHLIPGITVVVHPIDTEAHPSVPSGWRWAVMAGAGTPATELGLCTNAGWEPTENEAWLTGETVGAAAVKALRMHGIPAAYGLLPLDFDPIPAGGDRLGSPV